jgi:hypothetical protein
MPTSTPTCGDWIRVTPDGESGPVVVWEGLRGLVWQDVDGVYRFENDPPGTLYDPVTLDILQAARGMAEAIEGQTDWSLLNGACTCDACKSYRAYRAAVARAMGEPT